MAVSMGVYDKIINAVSNFFKDIKGNLILLLPYLIGAVAGIGALSFIVKGALTNYPMQTSGMFIGLIVGGAPILVNKVKGVKINVWHVLIFLVTLVIVVGMAFLSGDEGSATTLKVDLGVAIYLLVIGAIASATMIIPGVSGSLVLMLLGYYGIIISSVSNIISATLNLDVAAFIKEFYIIGPFLLGIVLGLGLVAKLLNLLFKKAFYMTYFGIYGLVFGSPFVVLYKAGIVSIEVVPVIVTIITFAIGFCISFFLGKDEEEDNEKKLEKKEKIANEF